MVDIQKPGGGDGRLRRLPLLIRFGQAVYPNLTLAALLPTLNGQAIVLKQRSGDQRCRILGDHSIPIDDNGNLRIRFATKRSNRRHIAPDRVLAGQVDESEIKDRVVFVGLGASGLASAYQPPVHGLYSAVEVHAQAAETILSKKYIRRHRAQNRFRVPRASPKRSTSANISKTNWSGQKKWRPWAALRQGSPTI